MDSTYTIGTMLKLKISNNAKEKDAKIALIVDVDDDDVNPPIYKLLIGNSTQWDYLRSNLWEKIE